VTGGLIAGLILAAGESRRMGSPKALLDFGGETFLDHLVASFSGICSPVIVVLGHGAEEVRAGLGAAEKAVFVVNADYRLGQFSSLQCGLRAVPVEAHGVIFGLVDHPSVQPSTLARLAASPAPLAIPRLAGRRGHPVFFSRALIAEFLALPPDADARIVVERHAAEIEYVEVDDPGILQDIDDPEAYRRLVAAL
jgi:molybdenum cofactor cytidylyltransferase